MTYVASRVVGVLLLGVGACASPAPPDGGAAACEGTYGCPGDRVEYCAFEALRLENASGCVVDADCVKVDVASNCLGLGSCEPKPAVLATRKSAFESAVTARLDAYCAQVDCVGGPQCVAVQTEVRCLDGACDTRQVP